MKKFGYDRKPLPSAEYLRTRFDYDKETGILSWRTVSPRGGRKVGAPAGFYDERGRLLIYLRGFGKFMGHRIIWKMVTGEDPKVLVDHKDGNPSNNKWDNLREANYLTNSQNVGIQRRNKSGFVGVRQMKSGRWSAFMGLGTFDTAEEAHEAYQRAAKLFRGEFASNRTAANDNTTTSAPAEAA